MQPLVEQLRILRRAEGISRDEHARRAGLGRQTLAGWEKAGALPNLPNFVAAVGALGYDVKIVPRREEVAPLRPGPLLFVVAGILRDNGARTWSVGEIAAILGQEKPATRRQIANALSSLGRAGRARFNGARWRAVEEGRP